MKQLKHIVTVPIDVALLLLLSGCGDQINDVIDGIVTGFSGDAIANDHIGLVAAAPATSNAYTMVGSTGQLSTGQLTTLLHLAWPQSYEAIETAIGRPHTRSNAADTYTLPNGNPVVIYYDATGTATGYTLGDSN